MSGWINFTAVMWILIIGLVIGAGLPALFAVGVRLNAVGVGVTGDGGDGAVPHRHPLVLAIGWLIFALVFVIAVIAVLYIARDFIGHQFGLYILGAKRK
jgi:hypothetical protein